MTAPAQEVLDPLRPSTADVQAAAVAHLELFRDARINDGPSEVSLWRPPLVSADRAVLRDGAVLRARARDLVRNSPHARNAVRMNRDAVSGSGVKLSLKIDWRSLGINDIEIAAEWCDFVVRAWEAHAESVDFQADARRQRTFSQIFALIDSTDYVDGEALAIIEMKPGVGPYLSCLNLVDVDRLSTPIGLTESAVLRGGIERDPFGEPIAYYIRESHPADIGLGLGSLKWQRVPRMTPWGRPIVLHTFDHTRPEMTRGVTEFAAVISSMKMLSDYEDTELQRAILSASYAAVIKTELDWSSAMQVIGSKAVASSDNPLVGAMLGAMTTAADYHKTRRITYRGAQIPHLLPNEDLSIVNGGGGSANFADFEGAFIRKLAAGLGVEAHELGKNYREVNYSAARAALLAVWRTYRARRDRIVAQFAMPYFAAWLEEAVALGTVPLPTGVTDFLAAKPYLCRGTFIAWGKPMIDPMKERQAQQLGAQMGVDTMEEIAAEDGSNWRDNVEQTAYEMKVYRTAGVPHPNDILLPPPVPAPAPPDDDRGV